jgi:hypothetical protein
LAQLEHFGSSASLVQLENNNGWLIDGNEEGPKFTASLA